jgi:hypothetical protein
MFGNMLHDFIGPQEIVIRHAVGPGRMILLSANGQEMQVSFEAASRPLAAGA